ncbi:MAG: hypothetical protein OXF25_11400 [Cyanobacteria bacterium MAG CAR3_bin_5]|nr:hypothetical protein [Cyanobacteria bacterium MAG CAR3_bin_5]
MEAKTIIGTENTSFTPTILAARNEMRSWRVLALDPAAMRRPDHTTQLPGIAARRPYSGNVAALGPGSSARQS